MNKADKLWMRELIWLAALFVIAILIDFLIFRQFSLFTGTIDIQMHDTYFVIGGIQWIWDIFIVLATFIYLIKEANIGYTQILPNVILSVLLVALLFFIFSWHLQIYSLQTLRGGWTVYPPLDALPGPVEEVPDSPVDFWHIVLLGVEFTVVVGLFLLGYKTGRLKVRS